MITDDTQVSAAEGCDVDDGVGDTQASSSEGCDVDNGVDDT